MKKEFYKTMSKLKEMKNYFKKISNKLKIFKKNVN